MRTIKTLPGRQGIVFGLFWVLMSAGCTGPQESTSASGPGEATGSLVLTLPDLACSWGKARALLTAQKVRVTLTDPQGEEESREYTPVSPGNPQMTWEGLLPGTGWKIQVEVFNTHVSPDIPQVVGKGTFNVTTGQISQVAVTCLPWDPETLDLSSFPLERSLPSLGELWTRTRLTREGKYLFQPRGEGLTVKFFDLQGGLLGGCGSGETWTLDSPGERELYMGLYSATGGSCRIQVEAIFPPANEGTWEQPVVLEPGLEFRTFRMGSSGGVEETSFYGIQAGESGTWWVDVPYSSEYRWDLFSETDGSTALASGTNTGGLKFPLSSGSRYVLKLKNLKSVKELKIAGRLLSPSFLPKATVGEGSPETPRPLTPEAPERLRLGGRNFDCTSWYTFKPGEPGWMEFRFGEAGSGSYSAEVYRDNFTGTPLVAWSNTENLGQKVLLIPGATYGLRVWGQFSSGIKETTWPLSLTSLPLPPASDLLPGPWHSGEITPGGALWYRYPLQGGQWYWVTWDDKTQGTGTYSGDIRVSVYGSDGREPLFIARDKGYSTPWLVQVPETETELFCLVQGYSPSSAGSFGLKVVQEGGGMTVQVR